MSGPRQGEEIRKVKRTYAHPRPTAISPGKDTDIEFVYYDFAPDGMLPQEIQVSVQWELTTFEVYTYWEGSPRKPYDTGSELYLSHTGEEPPIKFHKEMQAVAEDLAKECATDDPAHYMPAALACYNYVAHNFQYDYTQGALVKIIGLEAMHDSWRAWENKAGVCDEIANVYIAMLRSIGIPARPAAGMVHAFDFDDEGNLTPLLAQGHAWIEFWLPELGWVPADPTWGQGRTDVIDRRLSILGNKRQVHTFYYYFDSKDDILCMVIRRLIDKAEDQVRDIMDDEDSDAAAKVIAFYEVGIRQRVEHPILDQLRRERNAKLYFRLLRERFSRMVPLLKELVEQGVGEGAFRTSDPFITAAGLQQVMTLVEMLDPTPETFGIHPDVIAPLQDQMERILGAEPGTLDGFADLWASLHEMQWD